MKRSTLIAAAATVLATSYVGSLVSGGKTHPPAVDGWREPTRAELRRLKSARRNEHPEQPPPVTELNQDFNGDGQRDRVAFLISEAGDEFAPFIFDGAGGPPADLDRGQPIEDMHRYSLSSLSAGALVTICTERMGDWRPCESEKGLRGHVIVAFEMGGGGATYLWDGNDYRYRPMPKDTYNLGHTPQPAETPPPGFRLEAIDPDPSLPLFRRAS